MLIESNPQVTCYEEIVYKIKYKLYLVPVVYDKQFKVLTHLENVWIGLVVFRQIDIRDCVYFLDVGYPCIGFFFLQLLKANCVCMLTKAKVFDWLKYLIPKSQSANLE